MSRNEPSGHSRLGQKLGSTLELGPKTSCKFPNSHRQTDLCSQTNRLPAGNWGFLTPIRVTHIFAILEGKKALLKNFSENFSLVFTIISQPHLNFG